MRIHRDHSLGLDEAKRRVDQVAADLAGKWNLTFDWEGDDLHVHGSGVNGTIHVTAVSVEIHVRVGLTMMMLREPIRVAIEQSIDDYIH